jgi:hypothetical protein
VVILVAGLVLALRGSLLAGCAAVLVLNGCFNYQLVSFELGPLTWTLDRIAVVGLAAAYGFQRWRGGTDAKALGAADWLLAALLALLVANTLLAGPRSDAGYVPGGWRLVAGYLVPATLYWAARESRLTERGVTWLLGVLAVLGVYLAVTAVLEISERWDLVFPPHVADPSLGVHFGRARGPMLHSVSLGLYLGVGGLAAAELLGRRPLRRGLLCALLPLLLAGLLFTYTRSIYLGVALAAIVWCSLTLPRPWQRVAAGSVVAGLLALTFSQHGVLAFQRGSRAASPAIDEIAAADETAFAAPSAVPAPQLGGGGDSPGADPGQPSLAEAAALRETPEATRHSAYMRLVFAWVSWQMFRDRPLFGFGLGHFGAAKLAYLDDAPASLDVRSTRLREHHIHYLGLLTEAGAIGLGLFLALVASWARVAWLLRGNPHAPPWAARHGTLLLGVLAIYVVQWAFHELSYAPGDHGLLFLLAGIAAGLGARGGRGSVEEIRAEAASGPAAATA